MTWENGEYQPKQKRADEKKGRILDAALELFGERGYHATTAKVIAAKADVATGSFYRYFRDKKAVFLAVCQRMEEDLGGRVFEYGYQLRREGRSEQDILLALIDYTISAHHKNKGFHREVLAMQIVDADIDAWVKEREDRILSSLTDFLKPMRSSFRVKNLKNAATIIYYNIEEISHRAVIFDSPIGEKQLVRELQDMVLRYLFE